MRDADVRISMLPEGARRNFQRRLAFLVWPAIVGWTIFAVRNLLQAHAHSTYLCGAAAVLTGFFLLVGVRATRPLVVVASVHAILAVNCLGVAGIGMLTGQASSSPLSFLCIVPLFAAYQLSIADAVVWTVITVLLMLGVHLSSYCVTIPPDFRPQGWNLFLDRLVMLGVIAGFALSYRRISQQQQTALEASRDAALNALATKSQFLAMMSHEIRTPLHGLLGAAELLAEASDLNANQRDMVDSLERSGRLLLSVVSDILDYSRLEGGDLRLESIAFAPETCLDHVLELYASVAQEKGLDLRGQLDPATPELWTGDPLRLQQILLNLVSNALKFTPQGEVVVEVGLAGGGLRFAVKDTGIGISREAQDNLFKPFEQLDSSTTRRYGGSGLGLAISQKLAGLMGSEIKVESEPGQGSRFFLRLSGTPGPPPPPVLSGRAALRGLSETRLRSLAQRLERLGVTLAEDRLDWIFLGPDATFEGESSARRIRVCPVGHPSTGLTLRLPVTRRSLIKLLGAGPESPQRMAIPRLSQGNRRALVVEDVPLNRTILTRMLTRLGYQVDVAEDGLQAVEAATRQPYELIMMDLHLPGCDGLEATRRIRAHDGPRRPCIIAVTASVLPEDRRAMEEAGADDFVGKPLSFAQLVEALERAPTGSPGPASSPTRSAGD